MGSALNMVSRHNPDVGIMPQAMNAYFIRALTMFSISGQDVLTKAA
jgi:hypothetical protein